MQMRSVTWTTRWTLGVVATLSIGCGGQDGGSPSPAASPTASSRLPRIDVPAAGQLYHSVYPGSANGEEDGVAAEDVASYEAAVGRRVAWVYFSQNWYRGRAFPSATAAWIRDRGSVPFIRLMLRSSNAQNQAEPLFTLSAITAGQFDADLASWGEAARSFGYPVVAEFGTEVNGSWYSWNGTWNGGASDGPRRFREAYRHIVQAIRAQGATNVTWVFHINSRDIPEEGWNRMENYFPGSDVVDWLGLSVYGSLSPGDDEWPRFADNMDRMVPRLQALAPGEPIFVFEFAASWPNPRGDAAEWADAALAQLLANRWPSVRGFSWWNENCCDGGDMRVQVVPGLADVFRSRLTSPNVVERPVIVQ